VFLFVLCYTLDIMGETNKTDKILQVIELIESGMSERKACETAGINRATFRSAALRAGVADHYARALEALAMDQIEKAELTIEDMRNGTLDAQQARVELDARKWFASKFLPKRFGDKIDMTTNGKDVVMPILSGLSKENITDDITVDN
jgi:hypothetical protein